MATTKKMRDGWDGAWRCRYVGIIWTSYRQTSYALCNSKLSRFAYSSGFLDDKAAAPICKSKCPLFLHWLKAFHFFVAKSWRGSAGNLYQLQVSQAALRFLDREISSDPWIIMHLAYNGRKKVQLSFLASTHERSFDVTSAIIFRYLLVDLHFAV